MNLKGIFEDRSLFVKVFLLLGLLFFSFLIHNLLALAFVSLFFENGLELFFNHDLTSQTSVNILKIIQFFSAVGTFVTPVLAYGYLTKFDFGLNIPITRSWVLLSIALIILVTPLISFLIEFSLSLNFPQWMRQFDKNSDVLILAFLKMENLNDLFVNLLVMAVVPAIGEELFFRGFMQNAFLGFFKNKHFAIFFTAILFSMIHFHIDGFIPRLFLGAILGYMFFWTKSLWVPIIAHFTNNSLAIIISYPSFESFKFIQNYNHYGDGLLPETSFNAIFFSLISVSFILYLLYSRYKNKHETTIEN